ncbi:methyltransferase [Phenylobacterium sp.]|uniref:class I SAM-dependent methyltransferase n=1 Tax=Phenylobacterium sp. TaxID=1871053 RepID=UPI00286C9AA5|nr:methyltransferase [Phenylobacterium sp.]
MTRMIAALAAGLLLTAAGLPALAQAPPPQATADAMTDPAMKGPEVLAFIGLTPGDRVADIVAGRFVRALSVAVGPKGRVYAVEPTELVKAHPEVVGIIKGIMALPAHANVELITAPINAPGLPDKLDVVFIRQDYHDLHDKFMGPADLTLFNKAVFAALKPGGVYVVLDHAAEPGSGLRDTEGRHRIDPATVKAEVMAAGFRLDGESAILANPADDHTKFVFDPAIRGKTDQFLLRFRKPG